MYEEFFGLRHTPFTNEIPAKELYLSPGLEETLGRLSYVAKNHLLCVVTADVGCGKTTAVRRFNETLSQEDYVIFYLSDSKLTPRWFYKGLLDQLGVEAKFYRGDAKRQLHQQLEIIRLRGKRVVTVVDEAHLLDKETLEEIRFLLNCRMDSLNPMALVLVGQKELWDKLKLQRYAAIRQRIDIKCEMHGYDRAQTSEYIRAHLHYGGTDQEVFTDHAVDEIYKYSAGAARSINKVCTHCLMSASQRAKKLVDDHLVRTVIAGELP